MFNLLAYLFDFIQLSEDPPTREGIHNALLQANFEQHEIRQALSCLDALFSSNNHFNRHAQHDQNAIRIFNHQEQLILPLAVRGLLHALNQKGCLNASNREFLIRALMALPDEEITINNTKLLVLLLHSCGEQTSPTPVISELLSVLPRPSAIH